MALRPALRVKAVVERHHLKLPRFMTIPLTTVAKWGLGPGETADFEFIPRKPGEWRIEVKSVEPGWHIPLPVIVVPAAKPTR
ncbi:MAG: hypothetical protein ACREOG_19940 [Gemmatimonadaceae bacterium]